MKDATKQLKEYIESDPNRYLLREYSIHDGVAWDIFYICPWPEDNEKPKVITCEGLESILTSQFAPDCMEGATRTLMEGNQILHCSPCEPDAYLDPNRKLNIWYV